MPAGNVTVSASFDPKTFTLEPSVVREGGDNTSNIALSTTTPKYGDLITITATPEIGYELKSLEYYLQGQNGTPIPNDWENTYSFSVPSNMPNNSNITIKAVFGIIEHRLSIKSGLVGATMQFFLNGSSTPIPMPVTAHYNDIIWVVLDENRAQGYKYKANSFKAYNGTEVIKSVLNPLPLGPGRYEFSLVMPNGSVMVDAIFDRFVYSLKASTQTSGTITAVSPASNVAIGTTVTFNVTPATGYKLAENSLEIKNGNTTVKSTGFIKTGSGNQYSFVLDSMTAPVPADGSSLTVSGVFTEERYNVTSNPPEGIAIRFNYQTDVPFGRSVSIFIYRGETYRYAPGSVRLNNGTDNNLISPSYFIDQYGVYNYSFTMPARPVIVSASSERIPELTVSFNDPNLDRYIHFLDAEKYTEIDFAYPGQKVTVQAYKPAYEGAPANEIVLLEPFAIQSWWLNNVNQNSTNKAYTIPEYSIGRILTAMVSIGGVPHSVNIPIQNKVIEDEGEIE